MKASRLHSLVGKFGKGESSGDRYLSSYNTFEMHNIVIERHNSMSCSRSVRIYTLKPDGKQFIIYNKYCASLTDDFSEEITLPHGAWCYSVWQAFQYLEDLDYFTNEAKELKIQEERDNVHNWFLRNRK